MNHAVHYNLALCQWVFRINEWFRCRRNVTEIKKLTRKRKFFICCWVTLEIWQLAPRHYFVFWPCLYQLREVKRQHYLILLHTWLARILSWGWSAEDLGYWTQTCIVQCFSCKHHSRNNGVLSVRLARAPNGSDKKGEKDEVLFKKIHHSWCISALTSC